MRFSLGFADTTPILIFKKVGNKKSVQINFLNFPLVKLQAGRQIGSHAAKLYATRSSPSNCNSTDYS